MSELTKLLKTIDNTEQHPEVALDSLGLSYETLEEIEWEDEGKCQNGYLVVKIEDEIFGISVSRSGSYFSDYHYMITGVYLLVPITKYTVIKEQTYVHPDYVQNPAEIIQQCQEIIKELTE